MPIPNTTDEIREAFLKFFEDRDHLRHPPSSLIPAGDPTLLLTNSGMAQFKAYFSGEAEPPHPRVTTVQKSFRTTDIDEVGDATHLTLFEMLGNFSFGDYFKYESCMWALELMTNTLGLAFDRLFVTVHDQDEESAKIWLDLGVPTDRLSRFGNRENWWGPAGEEGPCGPCSEIHYYRGDFSEKVSGDPRETGWGPNVHDDFIELYNLVFTQFYHHIDGSRTELPNKNIDTGMGLERAAMVIQGVPNLFEADVFQPIIKAVEEMSKTRWGSDREVDRAIRVVSEHARSAAFLIGDGVVPGNEGRGYVLRRIIRRGVRFGRSLGLEPPFMGSIVQLVIEHMGHIYKELVENQPFVLRVVQLEEEKFASTVDQGTELLSSQIAARGKIVPAVRSLRGHESPWGKHHLEDAIASAEAQLTPLMNGEAAEMANLLARTIRSAAKEKNASPATVGKEWDHFLSADWARTITGHEAAYLYDTFGFPLEVTAEIAADSDLKVDTDGFEQVMERQRVRARSKTRFHDDKSTQRVFEEMGIGETTFLGYEQLSCNTVVVGILCDGVSVEKASEGSSIQIVLQSTPFYAEGGGQVGDRGVIKRTNGDGNDNMLVNVVDTQSPVRGIIVHDGHIASGEISKGDNVSAQVDMAHRERTKRNHTATHLLHAALRETLGKHVRQHGSLVASDRLRFDFTHVAALTPAEVVSVQRVVNDKIRHDITVTKRETTYREAIESGALAFFGDKYDNLVRTVEIANAAPFSYELCGGTHCESTGQIGSLFIVSEQSIGSGLRRLEAVTGVGAENLVQDRFSVLDSLSEKLQTGTQNLEERVDGLLSDLEALRKKLDAYERSSERDQVDDLIQQAIEVNGINLLSARAKITSADSLRQVGDQVRDRLGSGVLLLGGIVNERPLLISMVTQDLVTRGYDARIIAREAAKLIGGGGGGKPDVAQAGGRDPSKLESALNTAKDTITQMPTGTSGLSP